MYRVMCDNVPLYDLRDEELVLIDPKVTLELNSPGSFTCKIPPTHPHYDAPKKMLSRVTVYQDNEILFKGRITKVDTDYYNRKELYCEGELAFLNDTVQRPAEYHDMTPREYFSKIVEIHNSQVEADKQFEVGMVTVTNSTDNVYRYTNWESSLKTIKEDLIDDMGGYIRVRNEDGHRYLDYVKDYGVMNQQVIEFGENLLDFTRGIDMTDIATVVVPLGNRLEESSIPALEERLTIKSVNGGKDYIVNQDAVSKYGWIVKVVTWDDVTTPERLKTHGEKWLKDEQFENMTIEAKAVDLHYVDNTKQAIRLGDQVRIVSEPHGLDKYFPVTKMTISLNQLSQNTLTFNGTVKTSVSTKTNAISQSLKTQIEELPTKNAVVADAIKQATALITAATHGYVTIADDASELFICNDPDYTKATKVWRWNLNGLGYSSNGYKGDYETAMTMDGQILGDRIVGNSVDASKLTIDYRTSVTKEIASKAQEAQQNSEEYADNQLKNYYTKAEVQTSIQNTKDSILLSAKETATQYVDNKLEYYVTNSEFKVTTNGIESEVSKKLNSSEFSTKIQQSAHSVKVAWNNISKYIQFESGELRIYDSAVAASQKLRSKFNSEGEHFYRDDYYVGKIGTNYLQSDNSKKGLEFDLEYPGAYMCWAAQDSSGASTYAMKLTYVQKNKGWSDYTSGDLHSGANLDMHNWSFKNAYADKLMFGSGDKLIAYNGSSVDFYTPIDCHGWTPKNLGGCTGTCNFVKVNSMSLDGTINSWTNGCQLVFTNGLLTSATF